MTDRDSLVVKPPQAAPERPLRMVAAMATIGTLAAVLLVSTYMGTLPAIERNRAAALERAIFDVLPGATRRETYWIEDGVLQRDGGDGASAVYAGYDDQDRLVGVAIPAQGPGFQDVLKVIYGYAPDCRCIVGFKVLESKETPGLGDKIETDPAFVANFEALDLAPEPLPALELVKPGQKTEPWQIEGITGATISSRAVARILRSSTTRHTAIIEDQIEVLQRVRTDQNATAGR